MRIDRNKKEGSIEVMSSSIARMYRITIGYKNYMQTSNNRGSYVSMIYEVTKLENSVYIDALYDSKTNVKSYQIGGRYL